MTEIARHDVKRLLPLALLLVVACGESTDSNSADSNSTAPSATTSAASSASSGTTPGASSNNGTVASPSVEQGASGIPAPCQEGFGSYLTTIEPLVADYDPATATLGEWQDFKGAVQEKSVELLMANNATAPYSCSQINLEWAYFDASSPWDAILPFAEERAPETVAYLETVRDVSATNEAQLDDYVTGGCDAAVEAIQQAVATETAAGRADLAAMPVAEGVQILGLYSGYMSQVQQGACPRDALGNAEFGFMGTF